MIFVSDGRNWKKFSFRPKSCSRAMKKTIGKCGNFGVRMPSQRGSYSHQYYRKICFIVNIWIWNWNLMVFFLHFWNATSFPEVPFLKVIFLCFWLELEEIPGLSCGDFYKPAKNNGMSACNHKFLWVLLWKFGRTKQLKFSWIFLEIKYKGKSVILIFFTWFFVKTWDHQIPLVL